jgi:hypothetical protein
LSWPNYRNSFLRQGFTEKDLDHGGSDRFVDALVAWGNLDRVVARVRAHHDAGADHVAVQLLTAPGELALDRWALLSDALAR